MHHASGKPTVHRQFSETTAVLAGDSLIVGAFSTLTSQVDVDARRACNLVAHLANYTGFPMGFVQVRRGRMRPPLI